MKVVADACEAVVFNGAFGYVLEWVNVFLPISGFLAVGLWYCFNSRGDSSGLGEAYEWNCANCQGLEVRNANMDMA